MVEKVKKTSIKNNLRQKAINYIIKNNFYNYFLLILFMSLFLATSFLIFLNVRTENKNDPDFLKKLYEINNRIFQKKEIVALVNGEIIEKNDVEKVYNSLPDMYKNFLSYEDILNQIIDEKILIQEAANQKISVEDYEIENEIQNFLIQNSITKEQFYELLKERNLEYTDFKESLKNQMVLTKLLNMTIISKISISEKDIKKFYEENILEFTIPAGINVSHLIICHNESVSCFSDISKENALKLIKKIREEILDSNESFSFFVRKYSNEPNVNLTNGNLGFISMKDPIDVDFLNAAFNLNVSVLSDAVETQFGYHLIMVHDKRNESVLDIDIVKDQINNTLREKKAQELYLEYLSSLRNKSTINIFNVSLT